MVRNTRVVQNMEKCIDRSQYGAIRASSGLSEIRGSFRMCRVVQTMVKCEGHSVYNETFHEDLIYEVFGMWCKS